MELEPDRSMSMEQRNAVSLPIVKAPFIFLLAITLIAFGLAFPIYGTPPLWGIGRLTIFRLGILVLLGGALFYKLGTGFLRDSIVKAFLLLFLLRLLSLASSTEQAQGRQQLLWYGEGITYFILLLAVFRRYPAAYQHCCKVAMIAAAMAVSFCAVQYIVYSRFGEVIVLPFSLSSFGRQEDPYGWYPLGGGGRIIGPFMDPNMTGSYVVFSLCFLLPTLYRGRQYAVLGTAAIFICIVAMNGSGSRQAVVAFAGAAVLFVWNQFRRRVDVLILCILVACAIPFLVLEHFRMASEYGETPQAGSIDIIGRTIHERETEETGGGGARLYYSRILLQSLDFRTFLLGQGEGSGEWTAHNAYLIVLQENGLCAMLCLLFISVKLLWRTQKATAALFRERRRDLLVEAGPLVILVWILLLGLNWSQLNQNSPWLFLALTMGKLVVSSEQRAAFVAKSSARRNVPPVLARQSRGSLSAL